MLDKPMSPDDFAFAVGNMVQQAVKKDEEGNPTEIIDHDIFIPALLKLIVDQVHGLTNSYGAIQLELQGKEDKSRIIIAR